MRRVGGKVCGQEGLAPGVSEVTAWAWYGVVAVVLLVSLAQGQSWWRGGYSAATKWDGGRVGAAWCWRAAARG